MDWRLSHAKQDFDTSIKNIRTTSIGNSVLMLIYLMYSTSYDLRRVFILLLPILIIELLRRAYEWDQTILNRLILRVYLLTVLLEYMMCGHLAIGLEMSPYSKGMLLDVFLTLVPYIYYALRIGLVYPLYIVEQSRKDMVLVEQQRVSDVQVQF